LTPTQMRQNLINSGYQGGTGSQESGKNSLSLKGI
jgi:hypothetical protein